MGRPVLPQVGVSSCLLGERVRYDGDHRRQADLLREFSGKVTWLPVCPEFELGLGVPRETIQIELDGAQLRLVATETRRDLTRQMQSWAQQRILKLGGLSGYVFKARSPSCGVGSVSVKGSDGKTSGFFALALAARFPELPIVEEEALADALERRRFLERVRAYAQSNRAAI